MPTRHRCVLVDIPAGAILCWVVMGAAPAPGRCREMAGCIAHIDGPRWLAAMESGVFVAALADDGSVNTELLAAARHASPACVSTTVVAIVRAAFLRAPCSSTWRRQKPVGVVNGFDANGNQRALVDQLIVPTAWRSAPTAAPCTSPIHTRVATVWASDYDVASGTPTNRRVSCHAARGPARWRRGGRRRLLLDLRQRCRLLVHRYTPTANSTARSQCGEKSRPMCAFGGENLDTLFVTSSPPRRR